MLTSRALTMRVVVAGLAGAMALLTVAPPAPADSARDHRLPRWHITSTGSTEQFRGLAPVDRRTAWVSGESGTVLRTANAGRSWQDVSPPHAEGLALRDIEAFGPRRAVTLSIGAGEDSRIYRTDDAGRTWREVFRNREATAFYDCMAFGSRGRGLALSDPVDGKFRLARTTNHGRSWSVARHVRMPAALDGEFAFAASGTCIVAGPKGSYWFATGGVDHPRVFRSTDGGYTWRVTETPLRGGAAAGVYSLAFKGPLQGVIVGGDYTAGDDGSDAAAVTWDGGRTWWPSRGPVHGYRSGVDYVQGQRAVAVGPNGSDLSRDGGRTWTSFDDDWYDGVQCVRHACWASGTDGRVAWLAR